MKWGLMAWCGGQTREAVLGCTAEAGEETEEKEEDIAQNLGSCTSCQLKHTVGSRKYLNSANSGRDRWYSSSSIKA